MGTGHLFKLHTFELLIRIPSGMTSKSSNAVLLGKKLHFLSLQWNVYWRKRASIFLSNVKWFFTVCDYTRISSWNTIRIQHIKKQVIHGTYEHRRCICKPHEHYLLYIKTISSKECGLQNIFVSNMILPVSAIKIHRCEVLPTSHLVKQILVLWQ